MTKTFWLASAFAVALPASAWAQERVTVQNFTRAETDGYLITNSPDGIGVFSHHREPVGLDDQTVIRMQRDTLYSSAVFDLTTPATFTIPDHGDRFMTVLVINQDHYVKGLYTEPGNYTLTQEDMGTRYAIALVRTFVDANNPDDIAAANALQDQLAITQDSPGALELPDWNDDQRTAIRNLLNQLTPYGDTSFQSFGDVDEVDPISHLLGTAIGWGGNPPDAAVYEFGLVDNPDGQQAYTLNVGDVPVDGFWSITVYNKDGYMEAPIENAALNNVTAVQNDDGTYTIRFGGDPSAPNYLHIMDGWNYAVRLYEPQQEIIDGSWTFPAAVAVE